ncbi:DUF6882 domain-containing protein [Streptomyces sp. NPDC096193]|uniref:DUF6882 domain-containing protein n=1 Tax=Streptomyces sp. NPDC096193 TaxID=3155821 RepID=UPI00331ACE5B
MASGVLNHEVTGRCVNSTSDVGSSLRSERPPRGQDQRAGVITWAFPEKLARAPAQILAGSSPLSSSWLSAWANESVLRAMSRDARPVRDWAEAHGHHAPAQLPLSALVRVRARADSCRRERQWHA